MFCERCMEKKKNQELNYLYSFSILCCLLYSSPDSSVCLSKQLEEELSQMKGTYEALNTQLMMELPILTRCGSEVLSLATRSLVAARMYLQGHLAKLYLQLAQVRIGTDTEGLWGRELGNRGGRGC